MIKIRNKRIALLLVLAMLATMFVGVGAASAATSENGNMSISKSINKNITEEVADDLGYVKVSVDAEDVIAGYIRWQVELPSDVYFGDEDGDQTADGFYPGPDALALIDPTLGEINFELDLDQVWVDSSANDDINVDVTIVYLDDNNNEYDRFEGTLLLAQKGDMETTVTAASPKAVSTGIEKKIAKITFDEALEGSMEDGAVIALELPEGFKWSQTMVPAITQGLYGLTLSDTTAVTYNGDKTIMYLTVDTISVGTDDKVKVVAYITVYPDAPDGDVVVEVYEESGDANLTSTDITVAVVGATDITITTDDTDEVGATKRAHEDYQLWEITLERDSDWEVGDEMFLELPDNVEWDEDTMETQDFNGQFINNGLYDGSKGLWLTLDTTTDKIVLDSTDLRVGVKPDAKLGDLILTLSGDVADAEVLASKIADRLTVTATKTNVKAGLNQVAGVITMVENQDTAFTNLDGKNTIFMKLPGGVTFSKTPTVTVDGDEVDCEVGPDDMDDDALGDDVLSIYLEKMKASSKQTIEVSDIVLDVDSRYSAGNDIVIGIGGIDWELDDANRLNGADDAQFEKYADDFVYEVTIASSGSLQATKVVFTIGQSSYVKDGVTFAMDVAPFVQNNRTFVPIRFLANALGIPDQNIYWDQANQTATLVNASGVVVQFKLGSTTRLRNGIPETMDVAPIAQNGRIFLPARFTADAYDAITSWDAAAPNQVTISIN